MRRPVDRAMARQGHAIWRVGQGHSADDDAADGADVRCPAAAEPISSVAAPPAIRLPLARPRRRRRMVDAFATAGTARQTMTRNSAASAKLSVLQSAS